MLCILHDNTQCKASIIIFLPHTHTHIVFQRWNINIYRSCSFSSHIVQRTHKIPVWKLCYKYQLNDMFCWLCDRVIPEDGVSTENPSAVKKLVFCSGKVYYDLIKARNEKNLDRDIAIARVEQVQMIFFAVKLIYLDYSNTQALFYWWYKILMALSNILSCFYKEIFQMVLLYPCVHS